MTDQGEVRDLIADRQDLEDGLETLLAVDETHESWDFDDVSLKTGTFGELVGHDVVENVDDGYRLRNSAAVRAALDGETDSVASDSETESGGGFLSDIPVPAVTGQSTVVGLVLFLAFVVPRAIPYSTVFRDGRVVLTANDPYFYRYSVDQLLAQSQSPLGLGALVGPPLSEHGEPLLVATLWFVSTLFGGSREIAGVVLAIYPLVAALGIGALVYVLGARVIGDRRVGIVAAFLLGITPAHAMRTSVGFADHHAFDYFWLLAVVTVLAWLVIRDDDLTCRRTRRGVLALGIAVAALTLSWNGSPLVLLPVAGYLAVVVPIDVSEDRSPIVSTAPVLAGLVVGAVLTLGIHISIGWQRPTVAAVPGLLAVGGVGLAGGGELLRRRGLSVEHLVALEIGVPVVGILSIGVLVDGLFGQLLGGIGFLLGTGGIGETASAFGFNRLLGVEFFGFLVILALPFLLWAGKRALLGERHWLVLSAFGWSLLVLSVFQLRFVGQLSPIVALFATLTVLWALARIDLTAMPAPLQSSDDDAVSTTDSLDVRTWLDADALSVRSGSVAFLLIVALVGPSLVFLPSQVSGSAVDDPTYESATWMAGYADEQGWTYPENFVLSDWGDSRVYNYPVNGVADNYSFARGNYSAFISASHADPWYDQLRDRVGFVVLEPLPPRSNTVQQHLYNTYGSRWITSSGETRYEAVSHYRAVFATADGAHKVFTLVPGARLVGEAPPNATVTVRTTVEIPNDEFTYRKRANLTASGEYHAVVPYPGEYTVEVGNRTTTVTVPERAVRNGTQVAIRG